MLKKLINKEIGLIFILGFLILCGAFFWLSSDRTEDFGLNFFTEMLGVLITVIIVDKIIKIREQNYLLPQKLVVYEDVRLYVSRYLGFWIDTYQQSVPEDDPETIEDFFSEHGMTKILDYLYMDSEPNVAHPQTWWVWIIHNVKEFQERGDKILDRHSHLLEPKVYASIHQLTETGFYKTLTLIPSLKQIDELNKFPRIKVLGSYSLPPFKEDYEAILFLYQWCQDQYEIYKKFNPDLKKVSEYRPMKNKKMPPKNMIPEDIYKRQKSEWEQFKAKN